MRVDTLIADLGSSQPRARFTSARVLGLVEETKALEAIRQAFLAETDPEIKQALNWGGGRIHDAHKRGYTTLNDIFERFKINQEIENMEDPDESAFLETMSTNFELQLQRDKNAANMKTAAMSAGAALGGIAAFGAAGIGAGGVTPGAGVASSNIGVSRPEVGRKRIPAQIPTDMNFDVWMRRLCQDSTPAGRAKAAFEVSQFNNLAALPQLADVYLNEKDASVNAAVMQAAKTLYLNALYWQLTQDGSIDAEVKRRAISTGKLGKRATAELGAVPSQDGQAPVMPDKRATQTQESTKEELAEILRRAQENRMKKKK